MKFAHDKTLPCGRYLSCCLEPEWAKRWSRMLKWRVDDVLNPYWCADFAWFRDHRGEYFTGTKWVIEPAFRRGLQRAYQWLPGAWNFCDIVDFYPSVNERRLRKVLNRLCHDRDPSLPSAVMQHFERIDYDLGDGLPTGSAVACGLANAYLIDIDHRFRGDVLRYGDNYAVRPGRMAELCNALLDVGLHTTRRRTFTKAKQSTVSRQVVRRPLGRRGLAWEPPTKGRRRQMPQAAPC